METYFKKIKYILPTFLVIAFGSVIGISFLRWILCIQFTVFDLKEEVWAIYFPLIYPWIPITIWLRPRFRALTFKKETGNRRFLFQLVSWFILAPMLLISQAFMTTSTGKLAKLKSVDEIQNTEKARYYLIDNFFVDKNYGGSYTDFRTSGKYNENLNFDVFFVVPVKNTSSEQIINTPKNWYGVKYHKQISNRLKDEEKENEYRLFYRECVQKMDNYNFYSLDHFERKPNCEDKTNFLKAIEARIKRATDDSFVVLVPVQEKYEDRNGHKLAWIFGAFGIGMTVFLSLLAWPGFSESERKRRLSGRRPKKDDLIETLKFLIPKDFHFVTSIILDLNILVFIVMIFSGVHLVSPHGQELLEWGANRRFESTNGEWWRLFTSMFIHGGIMHLFLNIYGLVIASIFAEPLFGRRNYAVLYIISGLCGSLASIWWHPNTISVGASGAIFGLYGAILGLLFTDAFPKKGKKAMFITMGIFVGINLLFGLTGGIDNAAHIGGLLSGGVLGVILYKNKIKNEDKESIFY